MKKLLIATTALVATAGVAAAEVTISGNGRMGVVYNGDDLNFSSRVRATISMSGTTDGGLEFGGSFGVHNAGDAAAGNSGSIYISGAFGKLEMGDVVGAAEAVVGDLPEIGFTDIAANDVTYITGDGLSTAANNPVLLYTYTTGGLTFAVSFNDGKLAQTSVEDDQEMAIGVKYSFGDYAVALGYEQREQAFGPGSASHVVLGAEATFGTTTVKLVYGQGDLDGFLGIVDYTQLGLGVTSTFDAITVKAMVKREDIDGSDLTSWGIGAEYDLGGGAKVAGGIADDDSFGSDVVADLGLKFTF